MSVLAENLKTEKTENLAAGMYVESPFGFGIGVRDESAPNHWKEVTDISFADKKTIFIFPGSGTNSAETANGMCKIVEEMLPEEIRKVIESKLPSTIEVATVYGGQPVYYFIISAE